MKMTKTDMKKNGEELQEYLTFRRKGYKVEPKKGRGAKYRRNPKHKCEEW